MKERDDQERARVGLCASCGRARRLTSAKGSVFYMCGLAKTDPGYREYPPLPVRDCPGYAERPRPAPRGA